MNEIPEEIVKLAESGEVKLKTTKPQEVVYTVHKGRPAYNARRRRVNIW